jgi:hypothetical protein
MKQFLHRFLCGTCFWWDVTFVQQHNSKSRTVFCNLCRRQWTEHD